MRVILASESPARLATLHKAGVHAEVIVSGIDESRVTAATVADLTTALAQFKGRTVVDLLSHGDHGDHQHRPLDPAEVTVVIACDSLLEVAGQGFGKPGDEVTAITRWYRLRGQRGILWTGHHVTVFSDGHLHSSTRSARTTVTFADLTDAEIAAYAATGEPQRVAGAFTIDGLGGPFITRIEGDPHNVVGLSLPLVRQMLLDLGVSWTSLWRPRS